MANPPETFSRAMREGRFHEAANDPTLRARLTKEKDAMAGALLAIAAAHHHAAQGDRESARTMLEHALWYLETKPLDPLAASLEDHARDALDALRSLNQQIPVSRVLGW